MNTFDVSTPPGRGQGDCAPTNSKYAFDINKCVLFDVEIFPGSQPGHADREDSIEWREHSRARWCCGFTGPGGTHACVDGSRELLAKTLGTIGERGWTLSGYNSASYDVPVLRAILANTDPYPVSHALVHHDGPGLPESVRALIGGWPEIAADHIDLSVRVRQAGRIPSLKAIAANLGVKHLEEIPFDPTRPVTDAEWERLKEYNKQDLAATRLVCEHFAPELEALAALSARFGLDLRNVHPAGVAAAILRKVYRDRVGREPVRIPPPPSVRYAPPPPVRRPRNEVAGAWFDRLTTEEFPLTQSLPVVPEPDGPIIIGGVRITVGSGGIHSVDRPALYRYGEQQLYEADVQSYYPSMMAQFNFFPRALGDCGLEQFREILSERLGLKERAGRTTDKEEAKRHWTQAAGLKLVMNSLFGQTGNPFSALYDPTAFLAVTLSGQLLLIDLVERLSDAGVRLLSVNTDGLFLRAHQDNDRWTGVIDSWEADTGMTLETVPIEALAIEATNNYAARLLYTGTGKRRGCLSDVVAWNRVPAGQVVADAVVAALFDGTLPEVTVRACTDPAKFVYVTRRDRDKVGVLIDEESGVETQLPRLVRWYKAKGSPLRIEHRWTDTSGKPHKTTPPGATGIRLMMDLPAAPPGDIDLGWYAGEARRRVMANPDFEHLDPKWFGGHAIPLGLYNEGLAPCPEWAGKRLPRGASPGRPSYFWDWDRYRSLGTFSGAAVGVLVLDVDEPRKFRKWVDNLVLATGLRANLVIGVESPLAGCMVSYHRADGSDAVRAGSARGKLIFRFAADENHPLARVGKAALRAAIGCEIFYGKGVPTIIGEHPDGPGREYMLDGVLGPAPDWMLTDLTERATKKVPKPRRATPAPGATANPDQRVAKYATVALESEVAEVAAAPEGTRNSTLWSSSCALGELVGAGAVDRAEAEEKLIEACRSNTNGLPEDEAADVIRRGLDRGAERPRDLARVCEHPKPLVIIATAEHRTGDQACAVLATDPSIYQRGGLLVRVVVEAELPEQVIHAAGSPRIAPVPLPNLRERLVRHGDWRKRCTGPDGKPVLRRAHPPTWAIKAVDARGEWAGVRHLEGIVETPILRLDGTILDQPGYDRATGLIFEPGIAFPAVPTYPTEEDVTRSVAQIEDLVRDFPFLDRNHLVAWVAALFTPLARFAIPGPCPLFLFDANQPRVGKTKLIDIISLIATGRQVARTTFPTVDEELDKRILAIALAGFRMILFDNIEAGVSFGSSVLDAALTGVTYSGRVLGATKWASDLPLTTVFFASGNNVSIKGDLLGRIIYSRLESRLERPEERDDFAVKNLIRYVRERRGRLVSAALTVLRGYIVAGRPVPDPKLPPMGEYLAWSELVRDAVFWSMRADPCATKEVARAKDKWATQLPAIIAGWVELCKAAYEAGETTAPTDGITASRALELIEADPKRHAQFRTLLVESSRDGKPPTPQRLGNDLGKIRGKVHRGHLLDAVVSGGVNRWTVLPAGPRT